MRIDLKLFIKLTLTSLGLACDLVFKKYFLLKTTNSNTTVYIGKRLSVY